MAYEAMYQGQAGKCLICGTTHDKLEVDHCHLTGRVRGLLCGKCNRGIGCLNDDVGMLRKAIHYLQSE